MKNRLTTEAVVGIGAVVGLLVYIWTFLPFGWAIAATLAAAWEAFSLVDRVPNNTISEIVWKASDRYSLVPWAGGLLTGLAIGSGYMHDPYVIAPVLLLEGHFWFPRYSESARRVMQELGGNGAK